MIIRKIVISDTDWTPITTPTACNYWSVRCDGAVMKVRTDVDDPATEDNIAAGIQFGVTSGAYGDSSTRYWCNSVFCYLLSPSGPQTVVLITVK